MKPESSILNRSAMADPAIVKEICRSLKQMRLTQIHRLKKDMDILLVGRDIFSKISEKNPVITVAL